MEALLSNPAVSLENIVLKFVSELEDGNDHPETWQRIASLKSPSEQDVLKRLEGYLCQLMSVPQTDQGLELLSTLQSVCSAHLGDVDVALSTLQRLKAHKPNSLLISGALRHVQQSLSLRPTDSLEPVLKVLFDFIAIQNNTNQALLNKMQVLQATVEKSRSESIVFMHQQLHDLHQTLQLVSRRYTLGPKQRIRCVFIVSFYQAWNTLAQVYLQMKSSDDFEPIVVSTARKRAKDTNVIFGENDVHEFLESQNIPHIRLDTGAHENNSMDILKSLAPDIIFRQSAWHDLPPVFNAEDINFARLCYIPYSFTVVRRLGKDESVDAISSPRHTDLYYHRLCWRIFCETEMHKSMYETTSVRAGGNVVVTGYPKFDHLLSAKQQPVVWPIIDTLPGRRRYRVIWAPHHSVTADVMAFGTFIETHKEILQWASQSENEFEFVLKPHPALVSELVHTMKAFTQEYMDTFFAAWNSLSNTSIYEGGDYGSLFMGSDVMITDGVGFLSEYQLFEKPLVFIDSGRHFGFNPAGQVMMESANTVRTVSEVRALCTSLRLGAPDPKREIQQQVLSRIMPYPGKSAQNILQAIRDGLIAEGVIVR